MILQHGNGTITNAYYTLKQIKEDEGTGGYTPRWHSSTHAILERLRRGELIECKYTGPKGGKRYFVTEKGDRDMAAVCAVAK